MKRLAFAFTSVVLVALIAAMTGGFVARAAVPTKANPALPDVPVPADNPQTEDKVSLGKQLYFDPRLSADNTISCATCHEPSKAWANHDAIDTGIRGLKGDRNSGTVLDSGYMEFQFWDGRAKSLEAQALGPIENPVEMGETLKNVIAKLQAIPAYRAQFTKVFGTDVTADGIGKAIAAFERTVLSGPAPYDKYMAGDKTAMSESAVRGMELFNGKARCLMCHSGPVFSDQFFHNIGVGMKAAKPDIGREAVTKDPKDRGSFKTPMLRNVALTYPYMHDGSEKTLEEVIEFYAEGGVPNPTLDPLMRKLNLNSGERKDLVAFLEALTGTLPNIEKPTLPK